MSAIFDVISGAPGRRERILHVQPVPARRPRYSAWPEWVDPLVREAYVRHGIESPYAHQVEAAELARAGRDVVLSTGTASGKSIGYLLPALTAIREGRKAPDGRGATALYLSPTKALAADQLAAVESLAVEGIRASTYDGDTAIEPRAWIRRHANYVLTNPDLLHRSLLPGHPRWSSFLKSLSFIIIDECHGYRGLFGSHMAAIVRRLLRVAAYYGATPTVIAASATMADAGQALTRLVGRPVQAVTEDTSPRSPGSFVLWEPPQLPGTGELGAPARRSTIAETGELLADLVAGGVRTIAFIGSRRGVEAIAANARRLLGDIDDALPPRVAAYRGGYLPEERRTLEQALRRGELLAVASTNALELGVDISGLDAVVIAGWPGTRASLWQQAGRAGRAGDDWLAVLVARDDPLDTFLVHHPDAIFGAPVESSVFDVDNPYVLAGHLCAAAAELPLTSDDAVAFSSKAPDVLARLEELGMLRRRPAGWFWTKRENASDLTDIRGSGGRQMRVVESGTGRLLGTTDEPSAHSQLHDGAVYLHQGVTFVVDALDLTEQVALVRQDSPDYTTTARTVSEIGIEEQEWARPWPSGVTVCFGAVQVTEQVVSYMRRQLVTNLVLSEEPLDLPAQLLPTKAVWWTIPQSVLDEAGVTRPELPGAVHAAEHAAIGLLPLFATCDRWDIGGVSTALHADTAMATIFVHDGHPGGSGFAERGAETAAAWLHATAEAIDACECADGCPSCVQSPKCGNGNNPLDKHAASRLLRAMLAGVSGTAGRRPPSGAGSARGAGAGPRPSR